VINSSTSSSSLPTSVTNAFAEFGNHNAKSDTDNTGILYRYSSLTNLQNTINNCQTVTDLQNLVNTLAEIEPNFAKSDTHDQLEGYFAGANTVTLQQMKETLLEYANTS